MVIAPQLSIAVTVTLNVPVGIPALVILTTPVVGFTLKLLPGTPGAATVILLIVPLSEGGRPMGVTCTEEVPVKREIVVER